LINIYNQIRWLMVICYHASHSPDGTILCCIINVYRLCCREELNDPSITSEVISWNTALFNLTHHVYHLKQAKNGHLFHEIWTERGFVECGLFDRLTTSMKWAELIWLVLNSLTSQQLGLGFLMFCAWNSLHDTRKLSSLNSSNDISGPRRRKNVKYGRKVASSTRMIDFWKRFFNCGKICKTA